MQCKFFIENPPVHGGSYESDHLPIAAAALQTLFPVCVAVHGLLVAKGLRKVPMVYMVSCHSNCTSTPTLNMYPTTLDWA